MKLLMHSLFIIKQKLLSKVINFWLEVTISYRLKQVINERIS